MAEVIWARLRSLALGVVALRSLVLGVFVVVRAYSFLLFLVVVKKNVGVVVALRSLVLGVFVVVVVLLVFGGVVVVVVVVVVPVRSWERGCGGRIRGRKGRDGD